MFKAIEKIERNQLWDLPPGSTIEVLAYFRIWKDGVPPTVRKKPNQNPPRTEEWTAGWVLRRVAGAIEVLDNAHVKLVIMRDSQGNREHAGRFTSANHDKVKEYYLGG